MLTRDMAIVLGSSFFYLASPMLVNPLITGYTGTLGASAALMGLIGGLMNLCSLVMRPVAGNLADRLSRKRLAMIGAALMCVACVGYALADAPAPLAALRVVNGVGYSLCSVCMSTWLSSMLPPERVGSGMGLFGMMNALGMAVGPSLGLAIQGTWGYRAAMLVAGALAAVTVVGACLVRDAGVPARSASRARGGIALLDARVVPVALVVMLFTVPYTATQSFVVAYAAERAPQVSVGLFFPVYAAVLLGLRFALRRAFDTVGFGSFLAASSASAALSLVGLWLLDRAGNAGLVASAALMAGGYGVMCSVCQSTAVKLVGPEHLGLANSTYYMGFDLGMALGPIVGGLLVGSVGMGLLYPALLAFVPAACVVYVFWRGRPGR